MGGEEFSAFLNCRLEDAGSIIEDLLNAVRNIHIKLEDYNLTLKFMVSGGIARLYPSICWFSHRAWCRLEVSLHDCC